MQDFGLGILRKLIQIGKLKYNVHGWGVTTQCSSIPFYVEITMSSPFTIQSVTVRNVKAYET